MTISPAGETGYHHKSSLGKTCINSANNNKRKDYKNHLIITPMEAQKLQKKKKCGEGKEKQGVRSQIPLTSDFG